MMQSSQQDAEREASNGNGIASSDGHFLAFQNMRIILIPLQGLSRCAGERGEPEHICTKTSEDQSTCGKDSSAWLLLPVF